MNTQLLTTGGSKWGKRERASKNVTITPKQKGFFLAL